MQDQAYIDQGLGVPHVAEKPPVYGPDNVGGYVCGGTCSYATYNAPMVPILQKFWVSFAMTLDPNTYKDDTAPQWVSWGESSGQRLLFQLNANGMEDIDSNQAARCQMWQGLTSTMQQKRAV